MRHGLLAILCAAAASAAEPAFLDALARAPGIAAARARVVAADQAQGAAGVLPDPMLGGDIGRERPRMGEDMTMYGAMIEQPLPRWGERDAMRLGARAGVAAAEADFAATVGEHAAGLAAALAERDAAATTLALLRESRTRVEALRDVVRARIAAGGAMAGELLAIDTRLQQLDVRIADQERRAADAEAEARGRLGLRGDDALPLFAAPDPAAIRVEANPMARSAAAMRLEAQAMEREADARGNPETSIGLAWEREAAGTMEQSDKYILSFRMSLPIHRGAYADAADAARGRARAAAHEAHGATWMARSQVGRAQRAAEQAARAEAAAAAAAVRARSDYDAIMRQVGTGAAQLPSALTALDMVTEAGIDAAMARLDARMALADLWRLAPPELPATASNHAGDDRP